MIKRHQSCDDAHDHDQDHGSWTELSRAERLVVILYRYEEMTFTEIGLTLGIGADAAERMYRSAEPHIP